MNITEVSIGQIKPNPNNPRTIRDDKFAKLVQSIKEFPEMLRLRPIVVNDDMIVLGGNMRLKACKEAGLKKVPIIKASDLTEDQQREFIIKDNVGFGEWDWETLANEWDVEQLGEWGLDVPGIDQNDVYTSKVDSPIYEPVNAKPDINQLYDKSKYLKLIAEIEKSEIEAEIKEFLAIAANRHIIFNYSKIADYYAHSNDNVRKLMIESALIIVDFNKAIEQGFVKLADSIQKQFTIDYDE